MSSSATGSPASGSGSPADAAHSSALLEGDAPAAQPLKLDVTVEKVSTCQRRVKVSIPREEIDRSYGEAIGELMPTALLPGFRPGRKPGSRALGINSPMASS